MCWDAVYDELDVWSKRGREKERGERRNKRWKVFERVGMRCMTTWMCSRRKEGKKEMREKERDERREK